MSGLAPDQIEPTTGWRTWALDWAGPAARLASVVGGGVGGRACLPGLSAATYRACIRRRGRDASAGCTRRA